MKPDMMPQDEPGGIAPDETLAIDMAVGALGREDRRAAETRMRSDPAFRQLVEGWQMRLAEMDGEIAPVEAPAALWAEIAAELAPFPAPAARAAPMAPAVPGGGWWNSLALWRGLALAGSAAAVIAVAQIAPPPSAPGAPPQLLVAALAGADGKPLLSAAYDPLRGAVVLTPATQRDDTGKSVELWVIEGENPPRSLGLIDIKGPSAHAISSRQLKGLQAGATLAISIEPLGGSPTGLPTGPIVATGKLSAV